jgi:hypothetical protein
VQAAIYPHRSGYRKKDFTAENAESAEKKRRETKKKNNHKPLIPALLVVLLFVFSLRSRRSLR